MKGLFKWELSEHLRVSMLVAGIPTLLMVLTSDLLSHGRAFSYSTGGSIGGGSEGMPLSKSPTGSVILSTFGLNHFWILLSIFIIIMSAMIFRADREGGYAQAIFTLPISKKKLFGTKFLVLLVYSLLLLYFPMFLFLAMAFASVPNLFSGLFGWESFRHLLVFALYFALYSASLSVLVSLVLPNSSQAIMISFILILLPSFLGLNLPPFSFVTAIPKYLGQAFSSGYVLQGVVVPAVFVALSLALVERRDVV
ncbi:ABC transporter permease [Thermococcus gammatolerans]|uniref:Uncharacterized protein n=1 Tax=Thermococcus gammatolerans (strain DSM 15229 / JCM 11827 / EJ3) TaxID=593117 RepID=C5A4Y5_THEGJ|nr:ABC transporter permease [Thermococcus gammatolerans]ACS33297.1 Conserved hypothetical protein [Thermococcus gammatolerans EJ3]